MKKYFLIPTIAVLAICVSMLGTGCATTSGTGGGVPGSTNTTGLDPQVIADAAVILRSTARAAAVLAMSDSQDARNYINLAVVTLDTFITGNDYTPGALLAALQPVLKDARDAKVALAINTALDLYEIFWGRYVKNKINANTTASLFLAALRDGAKSSLDITTNERLAAPSPPRTPTR